MASTHKSLRSSTANKRPTTSIADGQIALNTNTTSPGLFFKDSTGATIIKIGPVHVGTTAPNATPPSGGSSGNSTGEIWLDTSLTPNGVKIWNGASWTNATPIGSTTVQGLLELATSAETQAGSDTDRAVTPAGLQSKVSDSTSTTSSTTIASSTAVKSAYDLANAALPKSGGTVTGNLEIGATGSLSFEGATADAFETTIAVTDPTADRTITLPDTTGTIVTTGDTGTVTSTMIADGTIVDGDVNASAAIAHSKLASITAGQVLLGNASNVPTATALSGDVTVDSSGVTAISSGVIVNADVNASAAIAGTKISPDFGSQTIATTGIVSHALGTAAAPTVTFTGDTNTGIYSPGADQVAISTNGTERVKFGTSEVVFNDGNNNYDFRVESDNNANLLFVDASADSLGIGHASPATLLHVADTLAGSPVITRIENFSTSANSDAAIELKTPNETYALRAKRSDARLDLNIGGTPKVSISATGLVGIGTTSPQKAFAVSSSGAQGIELSPNDAGAGTNRLISYNRNTSAYTDLTIEGLSLQFQTNNGNERARIDSSGRLLVGTSTARNNFYNTTGTGPSFQIEGADNNPSSMSLICNFNGNTNGPALIFGKSNSTAIGSNVLTVNGNNLGRITFQGNDGSEFVPAAEILTEVDGTPGANDMPGRLVFSTTADGASSPTPRFYLYSNGNVRAPGVYALTTAVAADVRVDADGYLYRSTSSIRYKKDVETLQDEYADAILNARPVWFRSLSEKDNPDWGYWGFIAEEVEQIDPRLCTYSTNEDGEQQVESVQYDRFVPHLLNLIKRQQQAIETLEAKVAALENP